MLSAYFEPTLLPLPEPQVSGQTLNYPIHDGAAAAEVLVAGDWAPVREFADADQIDPQQLYGPVAAAISGADFAVVNLELPLASGSPIIKDGPAFEGRPSFAEALAAAGFQAVSLANNHVRDQGDAGITTTLAACQQAGLQTVGAGTHRAAAFAPLIVSYGGLRIGLLAIGHHGDAAATAQRGGAADSHDPMLPLVMHDLRQRVDTLIVIAHGGLEYAPLPPPYWYDQLIACIHYGADAVVAHHPHLPQGMSVVERPGQSPAPILWSLGNFIFPPREPDLLKPPYMHLGFSCGLDIGRGCVHSVKLTPYHIVNGSGLRALDDAAMQRCVRMIEHLSTPLIKRADYERHFAQVALRLWNAYGRERVRGLTEKLCADDPLGLKHGQSHFDCPAHYHVYANALHSLLDGVSLDEDLQAHIEGWYAGTWPS